MIGLSAKLRDKLLWIPAADRPFFSVGQLVVVQKVVHTSTGFTSGQAQHALNMVLRVASCSIFVHHQGQHSGSQQQMSILQEIIQKKRTYSLLKTFSILLCMAMLLLVLCMAQEHAVAWEV